MLFVLLALGVFQLRVAVAAANDYLQVVDLKENKAYRQILQSKLDLTPFNCGRSLVLPPFEAEGSTSVYSVRRDGGRMYYVTNVAAAQNLWQKTDASHFPAKAQSVKVTRRDAKIPQQTAELVREVSLRMLRAKHGPRGRVRGAKVIAVDSTYAEYSLELPNGTNLYGSLELTFPLPDEKMKAFVNLWNSIYAYCNAKLEERPELSESISDQAKRLLARLEHG